MLIFVLISAIVVIFPIFLNGYIYSSINSKKLFFSIYLFKTIKLIGGYVQIVNDGFAIHLTNEKAIIIPFFSLTDMHKKFKPLKDYHITKFIISTDIGIKNSLLSSLEISFIINYIIEIIKWYFSNNKFHLKIDNDVNVYENKNILNIYLELSLVFNILMIIFSFIKILMEKIIYAVSNRKKQNN